MSQENKILTFPLKANPGITLQALLETLGGETVSQFAWVIEDLNYTGPSELFHQFGAEIDSAPGRKVLVPGRQVWRLAQQTGQVIDGSFIAFNSAEEAKKYLNNSLPSNNTTVLPIIFSFKVIDSTWIEIQTADTALENRIVGKLHLQELSTTENPNPDRLNSPSNSASAQSKEYPPLANPQLFDVVRLAVDKPELGLKKGTLGAIVEIYTEPEGFEVEFVDQYGSTITTAALPGEELRQDL